MARKYRKGQTVYVSDGFDRIMKTKIRGFKVHRGEERYLIDGHIKSFSERELDQAAQEKKDGAEVVPFY